MKTNQTDKAEQAALKEEYLAILARDVWPKSPRMVEYDRKQIARIVRLECGGLIAINKPHIETDFCFGYHDSAVDSSDYDRANAMAEHAATSEEYFIAKNMQKIEHKIDELKEPGIYSRNTYWATPADHKIRSLEWTYLNLPVPDGAQPITEKDRAALISAWEIVRTDFRRRLDTYLKRYGLSKIHSWSYWMDA